MVDAPSACGDDVRASLGEVRDAELGLDDHGVGVENLVGDGAERVDDEGADGDVGDEAAVHDVDVDPLSAGLIDSLDLLSREEGRGVSETPAVRNNSIRIGYFPRGGALIARRRGSSTLGCAPSHARVGVSSSIFIRGGSHGWNSKTRTGFTGGHAPRRRGWRSWRRGWRETMTEFLSHASTLALETLTRRGPWWRRACSRYCRRGTCGRRRRSW